MYCWNLAVGKRIRHALEVKLKRTDGSLGLRYLGKLDDTTSFGSRPVEQNLRKLDLPGGLEQLYQILIGS